MLEKINAKGVPRGDRDEVQDKISTLNQESSFMVCRRSLGLGAVWDCLAGAAYDIFLDRNGDPFLMFVRVDNRIYQS